MEIAANILAVVFGAMFVMHGLMILKGHEMQAANAAAIGWPYPRYRLVALPEIAGGLGLLSGFWIRELAAAAGFGLFALMIGAAILRTRAGDERKNVTVDLVLAGVLLVVAVVQVLAI